MLPLAAAFYLAGVYFGFLVALCHTTDGYGLVARAVFWPLFLLKGVVMVLHACREELLK